MLGKMSKSHQRQGSKMLQVLLRSMELNVEAMTLLQFSFTEQEDYLESIRNPAPQLPGQNLDWRLRAAEGRMRSRCCGLIEVVNRPSRDILEDVVMPFHRTVAEFLGTPSIRDHMVSLTAETVFDTDQALLSSALIEARFAAYWPDPEKLYSPAIRALLRFLSYANHIEHLTGLVSIVHPEALATNTRLEVSYDTGENQEPTWCDSDVRSRTTNGLRTTVSDHYLPAFRNVAAHVWHDSLLFDTPQSQEYAIQEAMERATETHNLHQPMPFILFMLSQCSAAHVSPILNTCILEPHYKVDKDHWFRAENKQILAAHLLIQSLGEDDLSVRSITSRNVVHCIEGQSNFATEFPHSMLYWNNRGEVDGMTALYLVGAAGENYPKGIGWSIWDFTLHHIDLHLNDRLCRKFYDTRFPLCFLKLLVSLLQTRPEFQPGIGSRNRNVYTIMSDFLSKIWASAWHGQRVRYHPAPNMPSMDFDMEYAEDVTYEISQVKTLLYARQNNDSRSDYNLAVTHSDPYSNEAPAMSSESVSACLSMSGKPKRPSTIDENLQAVRKRSKYDEHDPRHLLFRQ